MRRYNKYRVPYFDALLSQARRQALQPQAGREIVRRAGNPMLRYATGDDVAVPAPPPSTQETLNL
jgi:hypothetical protein